MSVVITIVIVSTTTSLVSLHCTASPNNHVAYCSSTISQRTFRLLRLTHIQISVRGTICYPVPVHLLITLCVLYVHPNISASNHRRRRLLWDPLHPSPNHAAVHPSSLAVSQIINQVWTLRILLPMSTRYPKHPSKGLLSKV